jgi:hypothetical protein
MTGAEVNAICIPGSKTKGIAGNAGLISNVNVNQSRQPGLSL